MVIGKNDNPPALLGLSEMPEDPKPLFGEIVVEAVNVDKVPIIAKAPGLSLALCSHSKSWKQKPWRRIVIEVRGEPEARAGSRKGECS